MMQLLLPPDASEVTIQEGDPDSTQDTPLDSRPSVEMVGRDAAQTQLMH